MNVQRVLVLSPHTDDGELGAGGTIARFVEEGREVYYLVFSGCESSVPTGLPKDTLIKECQKSAVTMGLLPDRITILNYQVRSFPEHRQEILEDLVKLRPVYRPDLVLVPSSHDIHQDHGVIFWEALRAFKKEASIWGYEHPWNNLTFTTDVFVKLEKQHVEKKLEVLREYKSQSSRGYMDENRIRALMSTRGAQLDIQYAEAFELIRGLY